MHSRYVILLLAFVAPVVGNARVVGMDEPLAFHSVQELWAFLWSPAVDSLHPEFRREIGYVLEYSGDTGNPKLKDERLLAYVNGETPRRLMLWGLRLRIEALKTAAAGEELLIAKHERLSPTDTVEESVKLYRVRLAEDQGWQSFCERLIDELTQPNQRPEPTARTVTPRADARAAPAPAVAHP